MAAVVTLARSKIVLAPTDFSAASDAALKEATHEAAARGATLLLLHVIDAPTYESPQRPVLLERFRRDARCELELRAERARTAGLACEVLLREGTTAAEILHAIDERVPELVVMAAQAMRGLQHFLLGSVTERVLQSSRSPVLVLPPGALAPG
jgi:nucleotide-binding universal stress UspA family protein